MKEKRKAERIKTEKGPGWKGVHRSRLKRPNGRRESHIKKGSQGGDCYLGGECNKDGSKTKGMGR